MPNIIQLIADLWETAQVHNKPQTIKLYKNQFNRLVARDEQLRSRLLNGTPEDNLIRLSEDVRLVFNLSDEEFKYSGRYQQIVFPRHIYHKVAHDNQISTLKHIGKFSGLKDHTSVRASHIRANKLIIANDPTFMQYFNKYLSEGDSRYTNHYQPCVEHEDSIKMVS